MTSLGSESAIFHADILEICLYFSSNILCSILVGCLIIIELYEFLAYSGQKSFILYVIRIYFSQSIACPFTFLIDNVFLLLIMSNLSIIFIDHDFFF